MIENSKKYWLYIHPHSYCNVKKDCALIYNTLTGENIEIEEKKTIDLIVNLQEEKNLGAICITEEQIMSKPYKSFIDDFVAKGMGRVILIDDQPEKPIQMMPIINLQRDIERVKDTDIIGTGEYLNKYLWELDIYLTEKCKQHCMYCSDYSKQIKCCRKGDKHSMPANMLQRISRQIKHTALMKLNFYGGDIENYEFISDIDFIFKNFNGEINIFNHIDNLKGTGLSHCHTNNIIITFPVKESSLCKIKKYCAKGTSVVFHFIISSEVEYFETEKIIKSLKIKNYDIKPFYTGYNKTFFKKIVMRNKDEILSEDIISFRKIFCHQKMNNNFFGKLVVLPDGTVTTIIGEKTIGNLCKDTFLQIIHNELLENTAWRQTRNKAPCSDCLLQYLCPSPSPYERAIGIQNLCLVK